MEPARTTPNPALRPCKVIIAGAGVAGLTLALALEKNGIDYLLLEGYPEIVAKAGAGICLLPNGLRILDQLGCYEDLRDQVKGVLDTVSIRDPSGEVLHFSDGWGQRMVERWGYSGFWCDRKMLLQTVHDHIADKSKLLAQKRIATVRHGDDGVEVVTTDGSTYQGDILVGADGTHSRVREEMVRHANERGVGQEYADDDEVFSTYACLFGLSSAVPGLSPGLIGWNLGKRYSYVVGTGPDDRAYWFLAKNMGKTYHGAQIPRFSEEDKERIVQEHWNDRITSDLRMSDLYKAKQHLICTPLTEIVYQKWHFGRMIVLGDAAHKMLPIIAQGGNQALETVAAMTNSLLAVLSQHAAGRMSTDEIQGMFEEVQQLRAERVSKIVDMGRQRQRMDTMETPELEQLMLNKFPLLMPNILTQRWDQTFPPAVSLRSPAVPARPKQVPFEDEGQESSVGAAVSVKL
ncbi:hypothetical protein BDV10DRAFT_193812 [Aspergillus recurvatus]